MSKRLEILEKALEDMKRSHRALWDTYGSELSAGELISNEKELEEKIIKLKKEIGESTFVEDPKRIIDN